MRGEITLLFKDTGKNKNKILFIDRIQKVSIDLFSNLQYNDMNRIERIAEKFINLIIILLNFDFSKNKLIKIIKIKSFEKVNKIRKN